MSNAAYFKDAFTNKIHSSVSDSTKRNNIHQHIKKYFDSHGDVLFDNGVRQRLIFKGNPDQLVVFENLGIHPNEVLQIIDKSPVIEKNWVILNNPFVWLMTLLIREYSLTNKEKELDEALVYFSAYLYSSLHARQFKYIPNQDIMDYTINNLSNKFLIKQYGTLFHTLHHISRGAHDHHRKELESGKDVEIKDYITALRTRISSFIVKLSSEYYENAENKNYLRSEKDDNSDEGFYRTDNSSFQITNITDKTVNFIISSGVHETAYNIAAKYNGVSRAALKTAVTNIVNGPMEPIREFILKIMQVYVINEGNPIETVYHKDFLNKLMKIYSKSNTTDELVIEIKDQLDIWLQENSANYARTERAATKSAFRKALYMYFCLNIRLAIAQ